MQAEAVMHLTAYARNVPGSDDEVQVAPPSVVTNERY
jgi:hypothetical protein